MAASDRQISGGPGEKGASAQRHVGMIYSSSSGGDGVGLRVRVRVRVCVQQLHRIYCGHFSSRPPFSTVAVKLILRLQWTVWEDHIATQCLAVFNLHPPRRARVASK